MNRGIGFIMAGIGSLACSALSVMMYHANVLPPHNQSLEGAWIASSAALTILLIFRGVYLLTND